MNKKFKLNNQINLDGFTSATDWIEDNLKKIDEYYENQKKEGKLKYENHLKIGRLISLGSIIEEIKPSDFTCKKEYDQTITNLYRNFFAYHVIPTLKDEILKKSDIRIIPVLGEIFSYKLIYTKDIHKHDEICISGEKLENIIPIEQVFCYCSPSVEFDISAKLESFFFGEHHRVYKSIIYGSHSERKKDKCLEVGVSYIKTVLGNDYFNKLIIETLEKLEDGLYTRLLDALLPRTATKHGVIFKALLKKLLPYIEDPDLKTQVQLHILLN